MLAAAEGLQYRFPFLAQRLFNTPLAVAPDRAEIILGALAERLNIHQVVRMDGARLTLNRNPTRGAFSVDHRPQRRQRGYDIMAGVAIIGVIGSLVQKSGTLRPESGITGYDSIRANLLDALENKQVRAIVFDVDSHGGEVAGLFDLCDFITEARDRKPIWAILSESAFSAAYAIASSCARVSVPRTGGTGSIGIIAMHVDMSRALERDGLKVTIIQHGRRKSDLTDTRPLSDGARKRAQAEIDTLGGMLDDLVARNRRTSAARVKALQAATFMGVRGMRAGLADAVMAPDEAFRALLQSL